MELITGAIAVAAIGGVYWMHRRAAKIEGWIADFDTPRQARFRSNEKRRKRREALGLSPLVGHKDDPLTDDDYARSERDAEAERDARWPLHKPMTPPNRR